MIIRLETGDALVGVACTRCTLPLVEGQEVLEDRHFRCRIHSIPAGLVSKFRSGWAALQRKAAKVGAACPRLIELGTRVHRIREHYEVGFRRAVLVEWAGEVTDVVIDGEMPVMPGGWRVLAIVSPVARGAQTNILTLLDPDADVEEYRHREIECDHCGTTRYRKRTLVLENAGGDRVVVGTSCMTDFVATASVDSIASTCDLYSMIGRLIDQATGADCDDPDAYVARGKRTTITLALSTISLLATILGRLHGFTSKGAARERAERRAWSPELPALEATADLIDELIGGAMSAASTKIAAFLDEHCTDDDIAASQAAIEWAQTQADARSDYMRNLYAIATSENGMLDSRLLGLAASLPNAHAKHAEWEANRLAKIAAEAGAAATKLHLGSIKERVTAEVRLTDTREVDTQWGISYLIKMTTVDGLCDLTWWSSRGIEDLGVEVGSLYALTGTVKAHDSFRDVPQTTVTRCKLAAI